MNICICIYRERERERELKKETRRVFERTRLSDFAGRRKASRGGSRVRVEGGVLQGLVVGPGILVLRLLESFPIALQAAHARDLQRAREIRERECKATHTRSPSVVPLIISRLLKYEMCFGEGHFER